MAVWDLDEVLCSITRTTLMESWESFPAEGCELALRDESLSLVPPGGSPCLVACFMAWTAKTCWFLQSLQALRCLKCPHFHLSLGVT